MQSAQLLWQAAGILEILGSIPYLISILQRKTVPSRATWWIWTLAGIITTMSYYASGARETVWQPLFAVAGNLLFAILSIRYGKWGASRIDIICFIWAIISVWAWVVSGNPVVWLISILIVGLFWFIPTLWKTFKEPESEDLSTWSIWWVSNLCNALAVLGWSFVLLVYPVYGLCTLGSIVAIMLIHKVKHYREVKRGGNDSFLEQLK